MDPLTQLLNLGNLKNGSQLVVGDQIKAHHQAQQVRQRPAP